MVRSVASRMAFSLLLVKTKVPYIGARSGGGLASRGWGLSVGDLERSLNDSELDVDELELEQSDVSSRSDDNISVLSGKG